MATRALDILVVDDTPDCCEIIRMMLEASGFHVRVAESGEAALSEGDLRSLATGNGGEFTYTGVPPGNGLRIGIDRDGDTWRDRDELDDLYLGGHERSGA